MTRSNVLKVAAAALCVALTTAACGANSNSPGVASAGGPTTTSSSPPSSSGGGSSSNSGGGRGPGLTMAGGKDMAKFASCMRKNGVPNFPDPSASGSVTINAASGIDPNTPAFRKALQACRRYTPNGGKAPSPEQQARMQAQALAFSACMRAHGVKHFPDPQFSGGRVMLRIRVGTGIDPQSPLFQAAQKACAKDLPGKPVTPAGGQ